MEKLDVCVCLLQAAASHLGSNAAANANRAPRSKAAVKTGFRLDFRLICSSFYSQKVCEGVQSSSALDE